MKKILCILCLFILLNGCAKEEVSKNEKEYEVKTYVTEEMVEYTKDQGYVMADFHEDYHKYEYLNKNMSNLIIGTVVTIDDIQYEKDMFMPYTKGTIFVQKTLYGKDIENDMIEFVRAGGYMTMEQFNAASPKEDVEKRERLCKENGGDCDYKNQYVKFQFENDIEIEAGKTYLMYIGETKTKGIYTLFALEAGLKEININQTKTVRQLSLDTKELLVKNNTTGEFTSLEEYLKEALPKK